MALGHHSVNSMCYLLLWFFEYGLVPIAECEPFGSKMLSLYSSLGLSVFRSQIFEDFVAFVFPSRATPCYALLFPLK